MNNYISPSFSVINLEIEDIVMGASKEVQINGSTGNVSTNNTTEFSGEADASGYRNSLWD